MTRGRRGWALRRGSDTRWRQVRLVILARDRWTCQVRGPRCTGTATTVDHIVPISEGGPMWDETNLRGSCAPCNYGRRTEPRRSTLVEIRTAW